MTVTPTYSGCPATAIIALDIEAALRGHGIADLELAPQLSPALDHRLDQRGGERKLRDYGIAPPVDGTAACGLGRASGRGGLPALRCRRYRAMISRFGSTPCKASWRCKACLEPFDYFKCI